MANTKQTAKVAAKLKARDAEERALEWQRRHGIGASEQAPLFEKFKDRFDIMYAVKNSKNIAPWRSKIYIPILAGKAWDFIARLADLEPRFVATIRDEWDVDAEGNPVFPQDMLDRAEKITQKLAYDWKNPLQISSPRERMFSTLVDTVVTGTGIAKVGRKVDTHTFKAREAVGANGDVNMDEELVQEVTDGHNTFEPVNIFNVKFAPKTDELQKAPWIIIDGYSTIDELKQEGIYDESALDMLDADYTSENDPMAQYNYARNRNVASQDAVAVDKTVKLLRTHECYSRNEEGKVVIETYVEGGTKQPWTCIRELTDPYWHNRYPLQAFYIRRKPYSVWGESLFENNETLQYATNDVFNHYLDNLNISLDGMIMMEENAFVEDFIIAPGETLIYKNEPPKQFKFNEPNPQQITMVQNELQKAVEAATVSQYATGVPNSENDTTQGTATGITKIMEAAEDKMGFMRSNVKSALEGVGQMWIVNDQQFMDRTMAVPVPGPDGLKPVVITPVDIQGIVNISVDDDSMSPVSKSGKLQKKVEYFKALQEMADNSQVEATNQGKPELALVLDHHNMAKDLSFAYGENAFNEYVKPKMTPEEVQQKQQQDAAAQAAANPAPAAPEPKPPTITIAYKDVASPEAKAAILHEAVPGYNGNPEDLMLAERNAQVHNMTHQQSLDVAKHLPEPQAIPVQSPAEEQVETPVGG